MGLLSALGASFTLGLATPLSAVCVLPLYPGFLAFLSSQDEDAPPVALLGVLVALGVVTFVGAVGFVFSTVLETSLGSVVDVVSPPAFALLALMGLALVAGRHPWDRLPTADPPQTRHPSLSAFLYGAFFGAIVLPCNPGFVASFFVRSLLFADPVANLANFGAFGAGMATPLLVFAFVSEPVRDRVLGTLTRHRRLVDAATGLVLTGIATYYLLVVFEVLGPLV